MRKKAAVICSIILALLVSILVIRIEIPPTKDEAIAIINDLYARDHYSGGWQGDDYSVSLRTNFNTIEIDGKNYYLVNKDLLEYLFCPYQWATKSDVEKTLLTIYSSFDVYLAKYMLRDFFEAEGNLYYAEDHYIRGSWFSPDLKNIEFEELTATKIVAKIHDVRYADESGYFKSDIYTLSFVKNNNGIWVYDESLNVLEGKY